MFLKRIVFTIIFLTIILLGITAQTLVPQGGNIGRIQELKFSPDGKIFATRSLSKIIKIWDAENFMDITRRGTNRNRCHAV